MLYGTGCRSFGCCSGFAGSACSAGGINCSRFVLTRTGSPKPLWSFPLTVCDMRDPQLFWLTGAPSSMEPTKKSLAGVLPVASAGVGYSGGARYVGECRLPFCVGYGARLQGGQFRAKPGTAAPDRDKRGVFLLKGSITSHRMAMVAAG